MVIDKNILLEKGWIEFDLKDYWLDKWNELHTEFNKEIEYNNITHLRMDADFNEDVSYIKNEYPNLSPEVLTTHQINSIWNTFTLWKGNITELTKLKTQLESKIVSSFQYWFFSDEFLLKSKVVQQIYKRIASELYELTEISYEKFHINLTMYDKNCYIDSHKDAGNDVKNRFCVILMYLNDDYKKGDGGELVIENKITIEPTFGKIVILDFSQNNIEHSVNKVLNDKFKRFATISFIIKNKSNHETIL